MTLAAAEPASAARHDAAMASPPPRPRRPRRTGRARAAPSRPGPRAAPRQRLGFRLAALLAVALLPLGVISLPAGDAWLDAAREQRAAVLMGETLRVQRAATGLIREAQGTAAALARTVRPLAGRRGACDAAMSHLAA
jgi:hypothetical protein